MVALDDSRCRLGRRTSWKVNTIIFNSVILLLLISGRFGFVPLTFFVYHSEPHQMSPSLRDKISSIGEQFPYKYAI